MTLGERIKACRKNSGMSQNQVAELLDVSRQAVTKWESGQSAPSTENLLRLAEIFGTTADMLLSTDDGAELSAAEQMYALLKADMEKERTARKNRTKRNIKAAALVLCGYIAVYLAGRFIWCGGNETSIAGVLFEVRPSGEHSYLYGWLLSSNMFLYSAIISVLPALWGKYRFSAATFAAFVIGLLSGIVFGPYPEGAATGNTHYGWAIWLFVYLASVIIGIIWEYILHRREKK